MDFFRTSTTNLLKAEEEAGGSPTTTSPCPSSAPTGSRKTATSAPSSRRKTSSKASKIASPSSTPPSSSSSSRGIADSMTDGDTVHAPDAKIQPMYADDVATAGRPHRGRPAQSAASSKSAGPTGTRWTISSALGLRAQDDTRRVVTGSAGPLFRRGARQPHARRRHRGHLVPHQFRRLAVHQRTRAGPLTRRDHTEGTRI